MKVPAVLQMWAMTVVAVLLSGWAATDAQFRGVDGFFNSKFVLLTSLVVAALLLAWSATRSWRQSAAWLVLALIGQAVVLQLTDAGPRIHYQHLRVDDFFSGVYPYFAVFLAMQATFVLSGLYSRWSQITAWTGKRFRVWQIAAIILAMTVFSATLSPAVPAFVSELLFAGFLQLLGLANLVLAAISLPDSVIDHLKYRYSGWFGDFLDDKAIRPVTVDRYALLLALFVFALTLLLNITVYERHPHIADEVVYLLHANYFSQGFLTLPLPPVPEAFNVDLMLYEDQRWYCPVPPGWPAMLALGSKFGLPWLVNPLLGALTVLLAYALLREIFNKGVSRLILLLFALSPWQLFLAMSFMTHTFSLAMTLLSALAVARMRRTLSIRWALTGGLALGVISLIRPLEGLAVALLLGFWSLGIPGWKVKSRLIPAYVLSSVVVGAIVLPYNQYLTGKASYFPIMAYTDLYYGKGANSLGFGPEKGLGWSSFDPFPGHGLIDVVINSNLNLFQLNTELFGWSSGSLLLVIVLLVGGRLYRQDFWMLSVVLMIIGLHSLYWFSGGPDFGARYWYLTILPLIILSVRGLFGLAYVSDDKRACAARLVTFILMLGLLTVVNFIPWRAIDKYHHFRNMRGDIRTLAQQYNFASGIVLVRGERFPDYMSAAVYNAPTPQPDQAVYAWDRSSRVRKQVLEAFPGRQVWLVDGPSVTGQGFRVVAGPLDARALAGGQKPEKVND